MSENKEILENLVKSKDKEIEILKDSNAAMLSTLLGILDYIAEPAPNTKALLEADIRFIAGRVRVTLSKLGIKT